MTTFNNLKSPKWTEEEKDILNEEASKAPISPPMLDRLQKKLPSRTRAAIASAIKRYAVTPTTSVPEVTEPTETDKRVLEVLRKVIVLKLSTVEEILEVFNITKKEDKIWLQASTAIEELRSLVDQGHFSIEQIASKYNRTPEEVESKLNV